jgi:pimeloyl-ACP methyl ester carboxylesterase
MSEALGYDHYVAHGSDLGAGITARLARSHPETVAGIHLATPGLALAPAPWSASEEAFAAEVKSWDAEEGGYAHEHATRPLTLAAGLLDSPSGLAAWIGEKVRAWSSGDLTESTPERNFLLATLTLYWTTGTIASSLLPYWAFAHSIEDRLVADEPINTPTAVTVFGGERVRFPKPPRELAERYFAITSWSEHGAGGHFPSVSEPDLLAKIIRDVFRPFRK